MFIASESHGHIFMNVITLKLKLATKHTTLSVSIDLLAKRKTDLRISLKIWNLIWNTLQTKAHSYWAGTTSQFSLIQVIKEPTHILSNSASCIDLIFTSQPNVVMHSGVQPSLHPNCYHEVIFAKFNLFIFYPPLCKGLVWYYQQANTDLIKRAIELFDWEKRLSNLDVNKQVSVFNETIMNIFENFIPHETITCNDKDPHKLKHLLQKKTFSINI